MTEARRSGGSFWAVPEAGRRELRRFGWVMALPLVLLAGWWYFDGRAGGALGWAAVAAVFAGLGLGMPAALRPVYVVWMYLARILGWANTHLLLGLVFYTLFTGIGLVMRLLGRDPLHRRWEPDRPSYWIRREPPVLPARHYERQF